MIDDALVQVGERLTVVSALFVTVIGAARGWWYSGKAVEQLRKDKDTQIAQIKEDRDYYKQLALTLLQTNTRAINVVEKTVREG